MASCPCRDKLGVTALAPPHSRTHSRPNRLTLTTQTASTRGDGCRCPQVFQMGNASVQDAAEEHRHPGERPLRPRAGTPPATRVQAPPMAVQPMPMFALINLGAPQYSPQMAYGGGSPAFGSPPAGYAGGAMGAYGAAHAHPQHHHYHPQHPRQQQHQQHFQQQQQEHRRPPPSPRMPRPGRIEYNDHFMLFTYKVRAGSRDFASAAVVLARSGGGARCGVRGAR